MGDFSSPFGFLHYFYNVGAPPRGHTRALWTGTAVTLRLIPTKAERDCWGPRGMAHCVWLLTFEHPSDLPLVYEWFGQYWHSVTRLYDSKKARFLLIEVGLFDIMLLNPRPRVNTMPTIIHPLLTQEWRLEHIKSGHSKVRCRHLV